MSRFKYVMWDIEEVNELLLSVNLRVIFQPGMKEKVNAEVKPIFKVISPQLWSGKRLENHHVKLQRFDHNKKSFFYEKNT